MREKTALPARLRAALRRWEVAAIFPMLVLLGAVIVGVLWGADTGLWVCVAGLPALFFLRKWANRTTHTPSARHKTESHPTERDIFVGDADEMMSTCSGTTNSTAVMLVEVDPHLIVAGEWRSKLTDDAFNRLHERLSLCVRNTDIVARCGDNVYGVLLQPIPRADLEIVLSIVERLQTCVSEPISVDGQTLHFHSAIGLCLQDRSPAPTGAAIMAAAECALRSAHRTNDGGVRSFTKQMQKEVEVEHQLAGQVHAALDAGEIRPWFQPQISTDTGILSGFEALARWHHPELGVLSPKQFLPAVAASHAFSQLGEVILLHSLKALKSWETAGLRVQSVSINLSVEELRDPRLADRIIWQVDRFDQRPERICVEILETVTLQDGDDAIIRNLRTLRGAGFRMDLDDFGTGHASISHIARFGVGRIKIDKSFVANVDSDPGQKRLVAAILSMAEQLGIETLAEGVETPGEHSTLAQLGCAHVQGYGIARPMPFEDTIGWVSAHNAKIANTRIGNRRLG
jgi:diguanylate cyclase